MAKEILSIRLSADGLSFWVEGASREVDVPVSYPLCTGGRSASESVREAVAEYHGILAARGVSMPADKMLYADTLSAVLVPEEVFDEKDSGVYMSIHGFTLSEDTYTVCSKPISGTVAVMKLSEPAMQALGKGLGEFGVAHLLQYNMLSEPTAPWLDHIRVYLSPTLCHVTSFKGKGMVLAESYPYTSLADINYYLSCIMRDHALEATIPVYIHGNRAGENAELLSRTFKGAVCG